MFRCEPVIFVRHFFLALFIMDNIAYLFDNVYGQDTIHRYHFKTLGLDIIHKHFIPVDQDGFMEVDRLEQGIAETLIQAGISYEISGLVNLPQ